MKHVSRLIVIVSLLMMSASTHAQHGAKRMDVSAMLRVSEMGDPLMLGWRGYWPELGQFSPDGKQVAVVVRSGDPDSAEIDGKLLVYQVADLTDGGGLPTPKVAAEFSSRTNYQPIASVQWLGNTTLQFAATEGDALTQVYRLNLADGKLKQLTHETLELLSATSSEDGNHLLCITKAPPFVAPKDDPKALAHGHRIVGRRLADALRGSRSWGEFAIGVTYYDVKTGKRRPLPSPSAMDEVDRCLTTDDVPGGISPDGRYALASCMMREWPDWWSEYTADKKLAEAVAARNNWMTRQLYVFDTKAGVTRPLYNTPQNIYFMRADPIWIEGGKRVLLPGALQPLEGTSGKERQARAERIGVVVVDPATGNTEFAFALDHKKIYSVNTARWDEESQTLILETVDSNRDSLPTMAWRRAGKKWTSVDVPKERKNAQAPIRPIRPIRLVEEESPNDRPVLYAEVIATGKRHKVFDPDPWIEGYTLGKVEDMTWKSPNGYEWEGTIYYPPGYQKERRYPFVLLTHGVWHGKFSPWGYARNYAAQPLASKDIVVLQMSEKGLRGITATPEEWPRSQEGLESAIDEMDRRGLIDRERVGIVSWSRTSNHVNHMLTHSDYPVKAAMTTDGNDFGWWTYISWGVHNEMEVDYGAVPFGEGLEPMLEFSPSFNLHRWNTPLIAWSAYGPMTLWDVYAGLRRLDKPVEYWELPDGTHDVFKMSQRIMVNTLMVDWFDFWLNEHEDPAAEKQEQYQRWRPMREQQRRVLSKPRPPLLDWKATPITK